MIGPMMGIATIVAIVMVVAMLAVPHTVRRFRLPIYIAALAVSMFFVLPVALGYSISWIDPNIRKVFTLGILSTMLFAVVAYIGVLPRKWEVTKRFKAVRAELAVVASLFALGHTVYYAQYFVQLFTDPAGMKGYYEYATVAALVLTALMIPLMITSFRFVRRHMKFKTWKTLQKTSYVFYFAIWVHILGIYLMPVINGHAAQTQTLIAYTVIWWPYYILRIVKYFIDRRNGATDEPEEDAI